MNTRDVGAVALMLVLGLAGTPAYSQHMHEMSPSAPAMEHEAMAQHPLGFPHGRFGSGTSWLPDATIPRHLMTQAGSWTLMVHGALFAGGIGMNGPRGDEKFVGPNMIMTMAERGSTSTLWRVSAMFSADAATVGGAGYPLLFQTGETWNGAPLHDHQHPHNVFSELSVSMTRAAFAGTALSLYAAPVGEPGLGPPAYPHRPVGTNDPLAPIGHHWQDATHIAYGVVTAGVERRTWRVEGSTFNGEEPGEDRAEIRAPEFDSFSGRVSFNPAPSWSFQASHGYLHRPEEAHPDHDAWRTTASAVWAQPVTGGRSLDLALVWGRNRVDRTDMDSWLIEGEWSHEDALTPFWRFEYVEKNAKELVLPASLDPDRILPLRQATLGGVIGLPLRGALSWGVGAQGVLSLVPRDLRSVYGDNPGGWAVFLRVRPRATAHAGHGSHEMHDSSGGMEHHHGAH
ncbi:MAG TPA: hypothetical protein VGQ14_05910 [Candidatus Eisenbacteria bacterium]|nr:hypothetical protein [Candidatus Eisenbacteria bacterium]